MKRLILVLLAALVILIPGACYRADDTPPPVPAPVPSPTAPPNPLPPPEIIPDAPPAISAELQARLDRLVAKLENERQANHIPGMALAVVIDDRVVLAQGFGLADIENGTPATADTSFAIGSSTKAFTATAIGMLMDDGLMDWDDPATKFLPYLDLKIKSDDPDAAVLIRDLLSHRTGFPRLGILTANGEVPREEVLRTMPGGEPLAGFRDQFYYCNEMYLAAGVAAGKAAGSDWDSLIENRILTPLGMTRSNTSYAAAQADPQLAKGYIWQEALEDWENLPMISVDNIGPAGSINSNVLDMAQWLRFQLGGGVYDGQRLLSEAQLRETWTRQTDIVPSVGYGLGWMLQEWEGQPVVEHGGNVDGFSATVAMLPESNLGFVLLSNTTVSPLQQTSLTIVWEALLGETAAPDETVDADQYAPYLGRYVNQHGPLAERVYTIIEKDGGLALDANGETVYDLKPPDENGVWYFTLTDRAAVSFVEDATGAVNTLNVIQDGMTFDLPREGTEFAVEIDLDAQTRYLGSYRSEEPAITTEVKIQNNRLAIDWPGETVYELYPPDEFGIWVFRMTPAFTLKFEEDAAGNVVGLTYYQAGNEYPMQRLAESAAPLPTVAEILALRGTEQRNATLASWGVYRMNGTFSYPHAGVSGESTMTIDGYDRARSEADFGIFGTSISVTNVPEGEVWGQAFNRPLRRLHGNQLTQALRGFPSNDFGDWSVFYDLIQVERATELNGVPVYVIKLQAADLPPQTFYVDASNGDILRSEGVILSTGDTPIYIVTIYEDYRDVDGIRMSFKNVSFNNQTGRTVWELHDVETNLSVGADTFTMK
jgi:CubicO group peptidase (beta-lactamase class C family)